MVKPDRSEELKQSANHSHIGPSPCTVWSRAGNKQVMDKIARKLRDVNIVMDITNMDDERIPLFHKFQVSIH